MKVVAKMLLFRYDIHNGGFWSYSDKNTFNLRNKKKSMDIFERKYILTKISVLFAHLNVTEPVAIWL